MAEPIQVKITDDTGTSTIKVGTGNNASNSNKPLNPQSKSNQAATTMNVIATMTAKRTISYVTSNVGKWTGNSRNQNIVNNVSRAVSYGMAMAVNPYLGMAVVALDGLTYAFDYMYENKWNQIREQQALIRTGGKGGYRR